MLDLKRKRDEDKYDDDRLLKKKKYMLSSTVFDYLASKNNLLNWDGFQNEDKNIVITAEIQGGKTFIIIPLFLIYLSRGITPIIILTGVSHVVQLIKRLQDACKELKQYLLSFNCFTEEEMDRFDYIYEDSITKCKNKDDMKNAVSGYKPRIIIVIKHHLHIGNINKLIKDDTSRLCVFFDEVQTTGEYKINPPDDDNNLYHSDNNYGKQIFLLKENRCILKRISISSTPQDAIAMDKNIYARSILKLKPNDYYTGINDWEWKIVKNFEDNKTTSYSRINSDITVLTTVNLINDISSEGLIYRYDRRNDIHGYTHALVMVKIKRLKEEHMEIADIIIKKIKTAFIIIEHGDGYYCYHSNIIKNNEIEIYGQKSVLKLTTDKTKMHFFATKKISSINITNILQYIGDQGVETYPLIVLINYDMSKEGISYISDYNKRNNIHITHLICRLPDEKFCADILQTLGRVNGNHGDDIKPKIYTTQQTMKNALKAYNLCKMQIIELEQYPKDETYRSKDVLKKIPIEENRVPKNYHKAYNLKITNTIHNPNSYYEEEILDNVELTSKQYFKIIDDIQKLIKKFESVDYRSLSKKEIKSSCGIKNKDIKLYEKQKIITKTKKNKFILTKYV